MANFINAELWGRETDVAWGVIFPGGAAQDCLNALPGLCARHPSQLYEAMLEGVMAIAAQIAANSPLAVTGCKEMINFSRDHSVEDSLKYMATWQSGMFRPTDMMKSFQAKAQKQAPVYDDLFPVKDLFSN